MVPTASQHPFPGVSKILEVRDTRDFELDGGRWRPIPGTGDANTCARCGRSHEVWARVETRAGDIVVVGTGCAELGKAVAQAATRARASECEHKRQRATFAAYEALLDEAPKPTVSYYGFQSCGRKLHVGDVTIDLKHWRHWEACPRPKAPGEDAIWDENLAVARETWRDQEWIHRHGALPSAQALRRAARSEKTAKDTLASATAA